LSFIIGPNAQLALGCPAPPSAKSLHALSAEVDSFGERMDLVLLRLATARLVQSKPANPGSIVFDYFSRVRGMPYRGRNVVCLPALALLARAAFCLSLHSNSNAPNPTTGAHLQDVPGLMEGACIHSPPFPFFSQHWILQEGSHSRVYQAFSEIIKCNLFDVPLPGMRSSAPFPPSSTLDAPLEAFMFDGVTFITDVKKRAYVERVTSPDGADFEMCAFFITFFPPHLF
jgi:hypothetical protein